MGDEKPRITDTDKARSVMLELTAVTNEALKQLNRGGDAAWIISYLEQTALRMRECADKQDARLNRTRLSLAFHDPLYFDALGQRNTTLHPDTAFTDSGLEELYEEGEPVTLIFPDGFRMDDAVMVVPDVPAER